MNKIGVLTLATFLGLIPFAASGQGDAGPTILDDESGSFLVIPGVGKIPIPPRARGLEGDDPFHPQEGVAPRRAGPRALAPPEPLMSAQERQALEMSRLFARLAEAEDEREMRGAQAAILRRWAQSGSDTIDLLAARAQAAATAGAPALAKALLDYVVALSPHWPEGFVRRAHAMAAGGDVAGALADLETAAQLEPKRFDALGALGELAEKAGDKKRALDAYRKALDISPFDEQLRKSVERMRVAVEGRGI